MGDLLARLQSALGDAYRIEREHRYHFFAPYPGQASVADFVRFRQDPLILFEDELPDLYQVTP